MFLFPCGSMTRDNSPSLVCRGFPLRLWQLRCRPREAYWRHLLRPTCPFRCQESFASERLVWDEDVVRDCVRARNVDPDWQLQPITTSPDWTPLAAAASSIRHPSLATSTPTMRKKK